VGLQNCDLVGDIVSQITETVTEIVTNQTVYQAASQGVCCYGDNQPTIDPPGTNTVPTGAERDDLCKSAQLAHDNGEKFLTHVFDYGAAGGAVSAGLIGFILALYAISLPVALLLSLVGLLVKFILDLAGDDVILNWVNIKPGIVCEIFSAASAEVAKMNVDAFLDGSVLSTTEKALFKSLYSQAQINKIFEDDIGSTIAYSANYCVGCPDSNAFSFLFTFDTDVEGWNDDVVFWESPGVVRMNVSGSTGPYNFYLHINTIWSLLGLPADTPITFTNLEMDISPSITLPVAARVNVTANTTVYWESEEFPVPTTHPVHILCPIPEVQIELGNDRIRIYGLRNGQNDQQIYFDNILLQGFWTEL